MIESRGPIFFLMYYSRDGPKKREIKIKPGKLLPRAEALEMLPLLMKMIRKKDKKARDFEIQEVFVFKNNNLNKGERR